jgi:hypothetical protein
MNPMIGYEGQSFDEILGLDLAGCYFGELYTLGLATVTFKNVPEDACPLIKHAHSFFYKGLHEPYYPHIAAQSEGSLIHILKTAEGGLVTRIVEGRPVDIEERIRNFVRPTRGLFNKQGTCVMFTSGYDSRLVQRNNAYYPRFVKVLLDKDFDEIVEANPLAFMIALGCRPDVPIWKNHLP